MRLGKVGQFYLLTITLLISGWVWLLYNTYNSHIAFGHTLCFVRNVTGYPCPACGTTDAGQAILAGRFKEALLINPLGYVALLALMLLPIVAIVDLISGRRYVYGLYTNFDKLMKQRPMLFVIIILLLLINWIWNLYKM